MLKHTSRALALSPLLALLSACGGTPQEGVVMTGWHMGWADLSHRISYLNVDLDSATGDANMGLIGGDWSTGEEFSDSILYRMGGVKVSTDRAGFAAGEISLVIEPSLDGSEFTANGTARVPYSEIGDWPNYVALISGFGMWTDVDQLNSNYPDDYNPANGYTSLGFGVTLGSPEIGSSEVSFPVSLRFHHGPTDEEILDRPQMSEAIPYATTEGVVRFVLIGYQGDWETISFSDYVEHPYEPSYSEQDPLLASVEVDSNKPTLPGWSAFDFVVNGGEGNNGDYLRSFGVELNAEELSDGLIGEVAADLTNSSAFELAPLTVDFSGKLHVLSLRGAEITPISADGEAEIGDWAFGPLE